MYTTKNVSKIDSKNAIMGHILFNFQKFRRYFKGISWLVYNSQNYGKLQDFGIVTLHVVHDVDICMYAARDFEQMWVLCTYVGILLLCVYNEECGFLMKSTWLILKWMRRGCNANLVFLMTSLPLFISKISLYIFYSSSERLAFPCYFSVLKSKCTIYSMTNFCNLPFNFSRL